MVFYRFLKGFSIEVQHVRNPSCRNGMTSRAVFIIFLSVTKFFLSGVTLLKRPTRHIRASSLLPIPIAQSTDFLKRFSIDTFTLRVSKSHTEVRPIDFVCCNCALSAQRIRCFLSSLNWRLSGSQRERYGHSIGIFTGGLVVSWELVIRDHSCDRLLMMLPVVWLAQWCTKAS